MVDSGGCAAATMQFLQSRKIASLLHFRSLFYIFDKEQERVIFMITMINLFKIKTIFTITYFCKEGSKSYCINNSSSNPSNDRQFLKGSIPKPETSIKSSSNDHQFFKGSIPKPKTSIKSSSNFDISLSFFVC